MSLLNKLNRSYIVLISAVCLIMLFGSLLSMLLYSLPNTRIAMQSKLNELENRINEEFSYLERAADTAFLNLNEIEYSVFSGEEGNDLQRYNKINSSLYLMRSVYSDVRWAFLFDNEGRAYADNVIVEQALESRFDNSYKDALASSHGKTYIYGLRHVPALDENAPVLLVGKMIRYVFNVRNVGFLFVAAEKSVLDTLYKEQVLFDGQQIIICSEEGVILSSTDPNTIGSSVDESLLQADWRADYLGRSWICQHKHVDSIQANIILLIPAAEFFKANYIYFLLIVIAAVVGLVFAFFESANITERVLTPLHRLTATINEVRRGNVNVRCEEDAGDDEIGVLASSFNHMLGHIEQLISSVEQKQQEKTYVELALQQNKIQPHFLYNSLNTISALCQMGQTEEASIASQLVAQYYRAVLSGGRDIITIKEELHNVELYLQIVQISRSNPIIYSIRYQDPVSLFRIPKLSLQPFVENAVKHGFRGAADDKLEIDVSESEGFVSIVVRDNGIGTDPAVFSEAMRVNNGEHFGIYSVCKRMQLLCGDAYRLEADSRPGLGTSVTLVFPASELLPGDGTHRAG